MAVAVVPEIQMVGKDRLLEFYGQALSVTAGGGIDRTAGEFAPYLEMMGREADAMWVGATHAKEWKTALRQSERQRERLSAQYSELKLRHDLMWQTLRDSVTGRWLLWRIKRLLRHAPTATGERNETTEVQQDPP